MTDFLSEHPTPWHYKETNYEEEGKGYPGCGRIIDANGKDVIGSADNYGYESGVYGDVESLIDFINSLQKSAQGENSEAISKHDDHPHVESKCTLGTDHFIKVGTERIQGSVTQRYIINCCNEAPCRLNGTTLKGNN